ncbi:MAG: Xaa-Pro dipeptidase, partial [Rhodanobacteraceae bacterium]
MTASPQDNLSALYPAHLAEVEQRSADALAAAGRDTLAVAAGMPHGWFLDDQDYTFKSNPHFLHWLPLTDAPGSWIVYTPGSKPKLIFLQPRDYWHVVPGAPAGYWVDRFDIVTIHSPDDARAHLPKDPARCAIIGEPNAAVGDFAPDNPAPLLDWLHYRRAFKTDYELTMMRVASKIGVHGHRAAEKAFHEGLPEFDIHCRYLEATRLAEHQLPYGNIIALDAHGAVLH